MHSGFRFKDQHGSLSNLLVYTSFFLPTSINTAWLSVASSVGLLIVPVSYGTEVQLEPFACVLAALVTVLGEFIWLSLTFLQPYNRFG
jgi:hypothetical protein